MDFILEPRMPKGGGSSGGRGSSGKPSSSKGSKGSKFKNKGGRIAVGGGAGSGSGGNSTNGFQHLPVWVRVLIIFAIIWFIIFLIALAYYVAKELKRKKDGKSFRVGHVLGHALLVSTGLWVPVYLYRKFVISRRGRSNKDKSGSYAKIEEGLAKERKGPENRNQYDDATAASYPPAHRHPQSPNPAPPLPASVPTGAAAEYDTPEPASHTAPTQHPPQYG